MKLYSTVELEKGTRENTEKDILYSRICYKSDDLLDILEYASEHNLDPYVRDLEDIITIRTEIENEGVYTVFSDMQKLTSKDEVFRAVLTKNVVITK